MIALQLTGIRPDLFAGYDLTELAGLERFTAEKVAPMAADLYSNPDGFAPIVLAVVSTDQHGASGPPTPCIVQQHGGPPWLDISNPVIIECLRGAAEVTKALAMITVVPATWECGCPDKRHESEPKDGLAIVLEHVSGARCSWSARETGPGALGEWLVNASSPPFIQFMPPYGSINLVGSKPHGGGEGGMLN
jgi:hypothetical protein